MPNSAPTATNLNAAQTYTEDTALNLTDILVSDVDSATVTVRLTLSYLASGTLSTGTSGSVTSTFANGTWTASGAIADVNALLAAVTFNPAANFNANISIATWVSDGVAAPVTGRKQLAGAAVNDAPVATNLSAPEVYTEGSTRNLTNIVVSDPDAGNTITARLTLSDVAAGTLTTGRSGAVTSTFENGVWTASGAAANVNVLLASVIYVPAESYNSDFSIATWVSDGVAAPVTGTKLMSTNAVSNNAPAATNLSAPETYGEDAALDLTNIVVTDPDAGNTITARLTLSNSAAGTLSTGTSGAVTSTFASGVWTASGAVADVNALLADVTFNPAANFNADFSIATWVSDGIAAPVTGSKAMTGTAVNDAPSATYLSAPQIYGEDAALDLTNIVVTDPDAGDTITARLTLSNSAAGTLSTGTSGAVTSTFASGVWTASGAVADVNALLADVTFNPAANFNGDFSIATWVSDGVALPVTGSKPMTGAAVNDAPAAINLSAPQAYDADTPLALTDIVVSDIDSANVTATLTLSDQAAGTFSTGTSGAVTSTFVNGVWTASGAVEDVNALLAGVTFDPAAGYHADFSIATSVSDGSLAVTGEKAMTGPAIVEPSTFTIGDATVTEGNSGSAGLVFTVTRSGNTQAAETVVFTTSSGTAAAGAGNDYLAYGGTLTFAPGQTTTTYAVPVLGDTTYENDETLFAALSNPSGPNGTPAIDRATGTGTIIDNEEAPTFSIGNATGGEGGVLTFTVTRSTGAVQPVQTVVVATSDDTAVTTGLPLLGQSDYTPAAQTLTFTQGVTSRTFTVNAAIDVAPEDPETFFATLSDAQGGATIAAGTGTGTIADAIAPSFSIAGTAVTEGAAHVFTVTRTGVQVGPPEILVVSTADGTATTGGTLAAGTADYTPTTATLTFTSTGPSVQTVTVATGNDTLYESAETFTGNLSHNGAIIDSATATINNNDAQPALSIANVTVAENAGAAVFTVTRSGDAQSPTTVRIAAANGTAVSGSDYTAAATTLTFSQGVTARTYTVAIVNDTVAEATEQFTVTLSNAAGATITTAAATGSITDNDGTPPAPILDLKALTGTAGLIVKGHRGSGNGQSGDLFGHAVGGVGDWNGDGRADLLIGAPRFDTALPMQSPTNEGQAYLIFGASNPSAISVAGLNGANGGFKLTAIDTSGQGATGFGLGNALPTGNVDVDINGDGLSDLVATEFSGQFAQKTHAVLGAITLTGLPNASTTTGYNVQALDGTDGFTLTTAADTYLTKQPTSVAGGDFNRDGLTDLAVGGPFERPGARDHAGQVAVVMGNANVSTLHNDQVDSTGSSGGAILKFNGPVAHANAGASVSMGDVNGDGNLDLIIGAPGNGPAFPFQGGRVYVVFGGPTLDTLIATNAISHILDTGFNLGSLNGTNGFAIQDGQFATKFGQSVSAAGDVNGDGIDDIAIGAPFAYSGGGQGVAYIVYGHRGAHSALVNAATMTDAQRTLITHGGDFVYSQLGASVAIVPGFNGDGFDDVVVGAPFYQQTAQVDGRAYVVFGGANLGPTDVNSMDAAEGLVLAGQANQMTNVKTGVSVAGIGNFNGDDDGYADIAIGAEGARATTAQSSADAGQAYVVYGKDFASLGAGDRPLVTAGANDANLIGTPGNDVFDNGGRTGVVMKGGANDDSFTIDSQFLLPTTATGKFGMVDGGGGFDTLVLDMGPALGLDFNALTPRDRIAGIERIDLNGSAQSVSLSLRDVLDMPDAQTAQARAGNSHQLFVTGDDTNVVNVTAGQFNSTSAGTFTGPDGNAYNYYLAASPSVHATLLIDTDIASTNIHL